MAKVFIFGYTFLFLKKCFYYYINLETIKLYKASLIFPNHFFKVTQRWALIVYKRKEKIWYISDIAIANTFFAVVLK